MELLARTTRLLPIARYKWRPFLALYAVWHRRPRLTSSLSTRDITRFYPRRGGGSFASFHGRVFWASLPPPSACLARGSATYSISSSWGQRLRGSSPPDAYHQYGYLPRPPWIYRRSEALQAISRGTNFRARWIGRRWSATPLSTTTVSYLTSARLHFVSHLTMRRTSLLARARPASRR